jgi:hypothetical protein
MQTFKLLTRKFTKAFTIYKIIYKGHFTKMKCNVRLECKLKRKWVQGTNNPTTKKKNQKLEKKEANQSQKHPK